MRAPAYFQVYTPHGVESEHPSLAAAVRAFEESQVAIGIVESSPPTPRAFESSSVDSFVALPS